MSLYSVPLNSGLILNLSKRFYQSAAYQDLKEKKENQPLLHGDEALEFIRRELDFEYTILQYNNTRALNASWLGSLGNERQNSQYADHKSVRGFLTIKRFIVVQRLHFMKWNITRCQSLLHPSKFEWLQDHDFDRSLLVNIDKLAYSLHRCERIASYLEPGQKIHIGSAQSIKESLRAKAEHWSKSAGLYFTEENKWNHQWQVYLLFIACEMELDPEVPITRKQLSQIIASFPMVYDRSFMSDRLKRWNFKCEEDELQNEEDE